MTITYTARAVDRRLRLDSDVKPAASGKGWTLHFALKSRWDGLFGRGWRTCVTGAPGVVWIDFDAAVAVERRLRHHFRQTGRLLDLSKL